MLRLKIILLLSFMQFVFTSNYIVAQCADCENNPCPLSCFTQIIDMEEVTRQVSYQSNAELLQAKSFLVRSTSCDCSVCKKQKCTSPCKERCIYPISTHSR